MAIASPVQREERDEGADRAPVTIDDLWEHHDYLHAVCRRMVGDAATAEDLVQETYVRALRHLDRLDRRQSLRAWLATVARRCSIDELRRKARHAVPMDEVPEFGRNTLHTLTDALVQRDAFEMTRSAIDELHPRERKLLLARAAGETVASLAAEEGTTARAVESVISRARAKLTAAVERGAALVLIPLGPALRRARAVWLRAGVRLTPPASEAQLTGARHGEVLAGLTAAAVVAVALMVGSHGSADAVRVEAGTQAPRASVGWFGPDRPDPAATLDRAAARRAAQVLMAPLGEILGLPDLGDDPRDVDGGSSSEHAQPELPSPGADSSAASGSGSVHGGGTKGGGPRGGGRDLRKGGGPDRPTDSGGPTDDSPDPDPAPGPALDLGLPAMATSSGTLASATGSASATSVSLGDTGEGVDSRTDPDNNDRGSDTGDGNNNDGGDDNVITDPPPPTGGGSSCWQPRAVCEIQQDLDRPAMKQL
ncbi:MAG: sigma-70 family RNA polymerase sigma factor [Actinobacteria bacterium]|nr:sigma-70 family RNA polymerase sigma factor [Actinomycetota bacterium]